MEKQDMPQVTQPTEQLSVSNIEKPRKKRTSLVICLVILLAIVAASGVYYWQHTKTADAQKQVSTLRSQNVSLTAQVKKLQSTSGSSSNMSSMETIKLTDATNLVKTFYDQYLESIGKDAAKSAAVVKKYGTDNLTFYHEYYQHGFDNIICAQATPATSHVTGKESADGVASVNIEQGFGASTVTISAKVVDQGGLKIDRIECSGNHANLAAPEANI